MSVVDERVEHLVSKNERFLGDCKVALEELLKLEEYYKSEIKQRKSLVKKIRDDDMRFAHEQGKITAYTDHITEIGYIVEIMLGKKRTS